LAVDMEEFRAYKITDSTLIHVESGTTMRTPFCQFSNIIGEKIVVVFTYQAPFYCSRSVQPATDATYLRFGADARVQMTLSTVLERSLSLLGYPSVAHGLLNRLDGQTALDIDSSAEIAPTCLLRGEIDLASETRLSRGCILNGAVSLGRGTNLEPKVELIGNIQFGRYCAVARHNIFQESNHETEQPSAQMRLYRNLLDSHLQTVSKGPITVGNDVWFGARSIILSGVTIGDGAVVAAGSVVTDDVEPYAVVAGVPANRVKWRFPQPVRERLLELAWWEWEPERIRAHRPFFEQKIDSLEDVPAAQ